MAITFDPSTKRIVLDSAYVEVKDIYSEWKRWVQTGDNAKFLPAFRVVGGDDLGGGLFVSLYCFLLNGWRIRPMEANHSLTLHGNISVEGGGDPTVPTIGNFQVIVKYVVPERAQAYESGAGGGGASAEAIAAAVRAELSPELGKIQRFQFTDDNLVKAFTTSTLYRYNGTEWVPV